jgi:hypothetical protein
MACEVCGRIRMKAAARTAGGGAKLPYGGLNRIRFEGSVSTGAAWRTGTPASACI